MNPLRSIDAVEAGVAVLAFSVSPDSRSGLSVLDLGLSQSLLQQLSLGLSGLLEAAGEGLGASDGASAELRVHLPEGWTLFWKIRQAGETRFLLARPTQDTWVATLAFEPKALQQVQREWGALLESTEGTPGAVLSQWVRGVGRLGGLSNFDLRVRRLPG
jgi:hypothetical protein